MNGMCFLICDWEEIELLTSSRLLNFNEFDFLLLCNKICGASHYNMQMKIIVDTEEDFNKWIDEQLTFKEFVQ